MARMVYMAMPKRKSVQAAVGRMAIRHGQLDHVLRMTIKSICEVSPQEARSATAGVMSGQLRERIEHLARKRFGDGPALVKLQALLRKCRKASEERNKLLHGVFAEELDGPELFMGDGEPGPVPSLRALNGLAAQMFALIKEINDARYSGFLWDAIKQSKPIKAGR